MKQLQLYHSKLRNGSKTIKYSIAENSLIIIIDHATSQNSVKMLYKNKIIIYYNIKRTMTMSTYPVK